MTQYVIEKAKCGVCGKESEVNSVASYTHFGASDLDTRPPALYRFTMELASCEHCGYVDYELEDGKPSIRKFLNTDIYTTCDGFITEDHEAKTYIRYALIQEHRQMIEDAFYGYLNAAWAFDDCAEDSESAANAIKARERCLKHIDKLISYKKEQNNIETLKCIKADLLRRTGQFEQLKKEYENATFKNPLISQIVKFQLGLAERKDTKAYSIDAMDKERV